MLNPGRSRRSAVALPSTGRGANGSTQRQASVHSDLRHRLRQANRYSSTRSTTAPSEAMPTSGATRACRSRALVRHTSAPSAVSATVYPLYDRRAEPVAFVMIREISGDPGPQPVPSRRNRACVSGRYEINYPGSPGVPRPLTSARPGTVKRPVPCDRRCSCGVGQGLPVGPLLRRCIGDLSALASVLQQPLNRLRAGLGQRGRDRTPARQPAGHIPC